MSSIRFWHPVMSYAICFFALLSCNQGRLMPRASVQCGPTGICSNLTPPTILPDPSPSPSPSSGPVSSPNPSPSINFSCRVLTPLDSSNVTVGIDFGILLEVQGEGPDPDQNNPSPSRFTVLNFASGGLVLGTGFTRSGSFLSVSTASFSTEGTKSVLLLVTDTVTSQSTPCSFTVNALPPPAAPIPFNATVVADRTNGEVGEILDLYVSETSGGSPNLRGIKNISGSEHSGINPTGLFASIQFDLPGTRTVSVTVGDEHWQTDPVNHSVTQTLTFNIRTRRTFGGAYSVALPDPAVTNSCSNSNVYTSNCSIEAGFNQHFGLSVLNDLGIPGATFPHSVIYGSLLSEPSVGFLGIAQWDDAVLGGVGVRSTNPYTGTLDCPSSSEELWLRIYLKTGDTPVGSNIKVCFRRETSDLSFGGAYQSDDPVAGGVGCRTPNPYTLNCSCPAGTRSNAIRAHAINGSVPIGSTLVFCTR